MRSTDRLSALDASFLHLEAGGAHMHVASVLLFEGRPPSHEDLMAVIESRLHLVPRYRQRIAWVPLAQGRPRWVDDPHFNIAYHVRHTALPRPGADRDLARLTGRLMAQPLDRHKPLWEIWLVEGLAGDRFAVVTKTHHALVDGISGVDLLSVLFAPDPVAEPDAAHPWQPRPTPSAVQLLGEALVERVTVPSELLRAVTRAPKQVLRSAAGLASMARAALDVAPQSPLNVPTGPHRRFAWVDADLAALKAVKDALGGTVNDVVLTGVALGLGRWLRGRGEDTEGLVLRAMVPVSVRTQAEHHQFNNKVAAMFAPLPVGVEDPVACFREVHGAMEHVKHSGQALGAQAITAIGDFAPPTILSQAARLQARQRLFNLVVTNVPGPQTPLYLLGHRLTAMYPVVPLAQHLALGVAVLSYDGRMGFGLLADYDALPDLDDLTAELRDALASLTTAAGVLPPPSSNGRATHAAAGAPS
ncbi:MAG TPA: wax ester/triacylglycerol synthase family O-acyltransferase [Baekduia sp.]|nr:wax ester/triacylglycerol synthase family O-acyltransferase [Baekduia sp.]